MKITTIELTNIRGFRKLSKTELSSSINIFIGANNSGKSTILSSLFMLQRQSVLKQSDITIGANLGVIEFEYIDGHIAVMNRSDFSKIRLEIRNNNPKVIRLLQNVKGGKASFGVIPEKEPDNLIYPYLSKRKTMNFADSINESNTNSVTGNFTNLYSKIDRLITPQFQPGNEQYIRACNDILGFTISTLASPGGKKAVYFVHNMEHIPLTAMGEGIANILGLVTDLCVAENKIFLIEEPENDIHPKALKALLKLIAEKSDSNQFFISTHSNIVMKNLGAIPNSKIFNITSSRSDQNKPNLFISQMGEVPKDPEARRRVLEELGYEFYDFGLWTAWLFLEESSAEVLIRDWFIKWYTPRIKDKLRTYSANSLSQVELKFRDFNNLFVFLHLEPTYKNKVWVIIDDGEDEKEIVNRLKSTYMKSGWNEDNFSQFTEHDFEKYYPNRFQERVNQILEISNKKKKRTEKKKLLDDVKTWISENEKIAKEEFKISAKPVIDKLKEIAKALKK